MMAEDNDLDQRDSAVDLDAYVAQDTIVVEGRASGHQSDTSAANGLSRRLHTDSLSEIQTDSAIPQLYVSEVSMIIAVALIKDAHAGVKSEFKMNLDSVRSYSIYNQLVLRILTYFFISVHHALIFFESPIENGLTLPYYVTMMLEICCIAYYIFRLVHYSTFVERRRFYADPKIRMNIALVILILLDILQYVLMEKAGHNAHRFTRVLRPMFMVILGENKQFRRAARNIRQTLPKVIDVLILFLLTISIFALISLKLFDGKGIKNFDKTPYLNEGFFENFYQLYVLVTSANNPDIMLPAYYKSRWYGLFFFVYILICMYIFLNVILAVVYNNYREHLRIEVRSMVLEKRLNLRKAFDLLTMNQTTEEKTVTYETFRNILERLGIRRGKMATEIMWSLLDTSGRNVLYRDDFLNITELFSLHFTESSRQKNYLETRYPQFYNSSLSQRFRKFVQHKGCRYTFDFLIILNAIILTVYDKKEFEIFFLTAFTFEILAKMYTFGIRPYFQKGWNIFDFVIITTALVGGITNSIVQTSSDYKSYIDIIMVIRSLRLAKILSSVERFRTILVTVGQLLPSIATFVGILFGLFYTFAIIGLEMFAGKIRENEVDCGDHRLNGSLYVTSRYCGNNFNDAVSAFVLLFELMVVNQWHILAEGFVLVTSKLSRAYFILFHMTCVILVMNIFTAFVIEAFILEYTSSKSELETRVVEQIAEHERKRCEESGCNKISQYHDISLDGDADHDDFVGDDVISSNKCPNHDVHLHYKRSTRFEELLMRMFNNEIDVIKQNENRLSNRTDSDQRRKEIAFSKDCL